MDATGTSMAISYGFAAINVVNAALSCFSSDPVERAKRRGYVLRQGVL